MRQPHTDERLRNLIKRLDPDASPEKVTREVQTLKRLKRYMSKREKLRKENQ